MVCFVFWEEATGHLLAAAIGFVLWVFRAELFTHSTLGQGTGRRGHADGGLVRLPDA
jgi:hypothetical protein